MGGSNQLIIAFTNENVAVWWEFAKTGAFATKRKLFGCSNNIFFVKKYTNFVLRRF